MKYEWVGWSIAAICICVGAIFINKQENELKIEMEKTKQLELKLDKCKG